MQYRRFLECLAPSIHTAMLAFFHNCASLKIRVEAPHTFLLALCFIKFENNAPTYQSMSFLFCNGFWMIVSKRKRVVHKNALDQLCVYSALSSSSVLLGLTHVTISQVLTQLLHLQGGILCTQINCIHCVLYLMPLPLSYVCNLFI